MKVSDTLDLFEREYYTYKTLQGTLADPSGNVPKLKKTRVDCENNIMCLHDRQDTTNQEIESRIMLLHYCIHLLQ